MKILVLYHYYWPDDVVSARHFAGLCEDLSAKVWDVEVWPSNRACHDPKIKYSTKEEMAKGVKVRRVWRPSLPQHCFWGRILNSIWMLKYWWLRLLFSPSLKPDVILIGTDLLFSVIITPWLKFLRSKAKIVHWCFDLYPEAAVADNILSESSKVIKVINYFMKKGYKACDLVADIGPCMREKLQGYKVKKCETMTPWALEEPEQVLPIDPEERKTLFGEAQLALLYSGNLGRAHDFYLTLKLAQSLKAEGTGLCFSARGSQLDELKKALNPEDNNVRFIPFAPLELLAARLSCPDVHVVSLRPEWTGVVLPSKFFGALAVGRPVLFEGPEDSSISKWIKEYQVGWVLNAGNLDQVAGELIRFSKDDAEKAAMFKHCHEIYQAHFSRAAVISHWDEELRALLP